MTTESAMDSPNPGTPEALDRGCTCPIIDNCYGKGVEFGGEQMFWYTSGCPLHGESNDG